MYNLLLKGKLLFTCIVKVYCMNKKIREVVSSHPNYAGDESDVDGSSLTWYLDRKHGDNHTYPGLRELDVSVDEEKGGNHEDEKVFIISIEDDVKVRAKRVGSDPFNWYFSIMD